MKEIREILAVIDNGPEDAEPVLATVVDVQGSSFRPAGAKMLILKDGTPVGTVSGGCLEADVLERAAKVRETGTPALQTYDTRKDDESVFSLNMGCRGIVKILMEPARGNDLIAFFRDNISLKRDGVVATSIRENAPGRRVIVDSAGLRCSSFETPEMTHQAVAAADRFLTAKRSGLENVGGDDLFFEYVAPPVELFVYGAGADAVPLADFAHELGWIVRVVDHRESYANRERFPNVDEVVVTRRESLVEESNPGPNALAVVMTHNFDTDREVLGSLLKSNVRYIGQMGPKARTSRLLDELREKGLDAAHDTGDRLHGPVGLDIGATTPEGIALSIVAEIQTFLGGREGGFLRNRDGSIYD